jgi:hypothetical protein
MIVRLQHFKKGDSNMATEKDNRVLGRKGARVVNEEELGCVSGGIQTGTAFCSFGPKGPDGCPNS